MSTHHSAVRAVRTAAVAGLVAVAIPAQASVIFSLGNSGGFSAINLDHSFGGATTVTGTVNPVPQFRVRPSRGSA